MRWTRSLGILGMVCGLALSTPQANADEDRQPLPVPYTFSAGIAAQVAEPNSAPPGANDFACKPSAEHPRPVILLHGFSANQTWSFHTISPLLFNQGYCVFSFTYGTVDRIDPSENIGGVDYLQNSAEQLSSFVNTVRAETGASTVDLVGWSEGGWLSRYYIQLLDGKDKVSSVVGLAPAHGPTNVSQIIFAVSNALPWGGDVVHLLATGASKAIPLVGQAADPGFNARVNAAGLTSPQVRYTNIVSRYDELVPPAAGFLPPGPNVSNVLLQDGCETNLSDHLSIIADRRATHLMLNALDPAHASPPPCVPALPALGSA